MTANLEYNGLVVSEPPVVKLIEGHEKLKAYISVVLNGALKIDNVRVVLLPNGRYHVAMPSRKTADGVAIDVAYPIAAAVRVWFDRIVLEAYDRKSRYVAMWDAAAKADPTEPAFKEAG